MSLHSNQTANHIIENWSYATSTARTTATGFVTADLGKIAFQTDIGAYYRLTATTPTWIPFAPYKSYQVVTTDATTTGQSLVDVTGLVTTSGDLAVSSRYKFHAVLSVSTTAVTTGTQYGVNITVSPTNIFANFTGPTTVATNLQVMQTLGVNANNTATDATKAFLTTASETGCITVDGFFTTAAGAGPVFSIRHLKTTSGTSTVAIGSILEITAL